MVFPPFVHVASFSMMSSRHDGMFAHSLRFIQPTLDMSYSLVLADVFNCSDEGKKLRIVIDTGTGASLGAVMADAVVLLLRKRCSSVCRC